MAKKDLLNVAVAWTGDLAHCNAQLAAAIYECARTIPGCRFYIIGTGNIIRSTEDATTAVIKSGNIDSVLNLIKHRSATGLDHFCPECQQWIRDSSLYSDQPSEVIRGERF